jgi:sulfite reductase (ferredoxin)
MADAGRAEAGKPSGNEILKAGSQALRGALLDELANTQPNVTGPSANLLKFHGTYQQDDRDARAALRRDGKSGRTHSFMVRTKLPAGDVPAGAYLELDQLAGAYANGTLRITTRQDIQFHGVLKRNLVRTLRAVNEALITTLGACGDVVRNVTACPAPAGESARLGFEALAHAISDHFLPRTHAYAELFLDGEPYQPSDGAPEEPFYGAAYMPRKFKIGLGLPHDNCIDVHTNDLALIAVLDADGAIAGWDVFAGGGLGMSFGAKTTYPRLASPLGYVPAGDEIAICEAVAIVQRDNGNRSDRKQARLKYLIDGWGEQRFHDEVAAQYGKPLPPGRAAPLTEIADHLGWGEMPDGRLYLGLYVANGRIKDDGTARQRSAIRTLVQRFGLGVRFTAQQNVLLTGVAPDDRTAVEAVLAEHGVAVTPPLPLRRAALACPALPTCGLAVADAERALPAVVDELEEIVAALGLEDEPLSVRMTGCPNGCARAWVSDIGFVGRSRGLYNVYVGGNPQGTRLNALVAELVPQERLAAALQPALAAYARERDAEESFGDFCLRLGQERIARLVEQALAVETV